MTFQFNEEQRQYLVENYLRKSRIIGDEWVYSIRDAYKDLLEEFSGTYG